MPRFNAKRTLGFSLLAVTNQQVADWLARHSKRQLKAMLREAENMQFDAAIDMGMFYRHPHQNALDLELDRRGEK